MGDRIPQAVGMLLRGDDGEAVMAWLRTKCKTTAALSCCLTRVRAAMMQTLPLPSCDAHAPTPLPVTRRSKQYQVSNKNDTHIT